MFPPVTMWRGIPIDEAATSIGSNRVADVLARAPQYLELKMTSRIDGHFAPVKSAAAGFPNIWPLTEKTGEGIAPIAESARNNALFRRAGFDLTSEARAFPFTECRLD